MARKAFKCYIEIAVNKIDSPGTYLRNRDQIYLVITIFGQIQRTRYVEPVFPLKFNQVFTYEKTFWNAIDPQELTELMEDYPVSIEMRQLCDDQGMETLLGYIDTNMKEFLFPRTPVVPLSAHRELYLSRTVDFAGLTPKLNFSTWSKIEDSNSPYMDMVEDHANVNARRRSPGQPRRGRSPQRFRQNENYERKTVSSVLRDSSPSPPEMRFADGRPASRNNRALSPGDKCFSSLVADDKLDRLERRKLKEDLFDEDLSNDNARMRPPFVIRKVPYDLLGRPPVLSDTLYPLSVKGKRIGRKKSKHGPNDDRLYNNKRSRSMSPSRAVVNDYSSSNWFGDKGNGELEPSYPRRNGGRNGRRKKVLFHQSDDIEDDPDVDFLLRNPNMPARYLHSAAARQQDNHRNGEYEPTGDFSEATIDEISRRVEETLRRSRLVSESVPALQQHHHHGCHGCHHHHCHAQF